MATAGSINVLEGDFGDRRRYIRGASLIASAVTVGEAPAVIHSSTSFTSSADSGRLPSAGMNLSSLTCSVTRWKSSLPGRFRP